MEKGEKYSDAESSEVVSTRLQTVDVFLRFLAFAASLVAAVVMGQSKQTALFYSPLSTPSVTNYTTAVNKYFPGLIYFEVALSVAGFYAFITMIISFRATWRPNPSKMLPFHFAVFDALMVGIVASATGTSASLGYVGLSGNTQLGWMKICGVYTHFCHYIAIASAVSLFNSIVLVFLVLSSVYSLYRVSTERSPDF